MKRVAINGFGRIGRMVLRAFLARDFLDHAEAPFQIVAINDLATPQESAHLLKYDTLHGPCPVAVTANEKSLTLGGVDIAYTSEPDPACLPWEDIDVILECSGCFTTREKLQKHLKKKGQRVLVSAPVADPDIMVVYGVNHLQIKEKDEILSNASCTTNCLAPLVSIFHRAFKIEHGYMTTIHAYTADQRLVDTHHKDLRRARAAGVSIIPTSTGAARSLGKIFPDLSGKLDGSAVRVPVANVSAVDFVFNVEKAVTACDLNNAVQEAAAGAFKGIVGINDEPLVSGDFNHNPHSSIFDVAETTVMGQKMCRVFAWYDNEWGFANRMIDVVLHLA